jgi:hypothetical protein
MRFYLSVLLASPLVADATPRTSVFTQQPYAASPTMGFTYSFYGEGIEYDPYRDLVYLSSLTTASVYAVPYYAGRDPSVEKVVYDEDDMRNTYTAA